MNPIEISFISISILIATITFLSVILQKKKTKRNIPTLSIAKITVIIPFRNEENNLLRLIESIKLLDIKPFEILWINDHSEDNSISILQNNIEDAKIIHLTTTETGKKTAIEKGILKANGDYILTWDADITFAPNYFKTLNSFPQLDMIVLPVRMKSQSFIQYFYELDYYLVNAVNQILSKFGNPIVANGANLLFKKTSYEECSSLNYHRTISSGDDMFLLNDFIQHKKDIRLVSNVNCCVETNCPSTIFSFLQQRIRWISKTSQLNNSKSKLFGIIAISYNFLFLLIFLSGNYIYLPIKVIIDSILLSRLLIQLNRKALFMFIPFFSIVHPFYMFTLFILSKVYTPEWKGRKVYIK